MSDLVLGSAFRLLAKPIQDALAEAGFVEATLPQTLTFAPILQGKNVLLIAPTGTGKTEAVLLPLLSKLVEQKNEERQEKGIQIIYITPLRALNRDMLKRVTFWAQRLSLTVEVRHGDTEIKTRRKQARQPPQILVTTPETLQAIIAGSQMRRHLCSVTSVIIDEVHELAESKRGTQLALALERLQRVIGQEFQRIGLSATVGNPQQIAKFIAGTNRKIEIIQAVLTKDYCYSVESPQPTQSDYELAGKIHTAPEAAARIRRLTELIDSHKSTLIFTNSRTIAEMLGHRFNELGRQDVAVHHGSLSKEERASIEDAFKSGELKAIICTSTLELGIDIGSVDLVVQYMSPRHVNSLIQRVGRSGHQLKRLSQGTIITVYPDDTLESIAAIENAATAKLESIKFHENALDVLAHQIAGITIEKDYVTLKELSEIVHRAYSYRAFDEKQLLNLIRFLDTIGNIRYIEEGQLLRRTGKTKPYYYNNLSMIQDERRYPVINVLSDRIIGSLGDEFMTLHARIGLHFIMRGKVWRIVQIEEETGIVHVITSEDPFAAIPGWDGEILPVPYELAQQTGIMRQKIGDMIKQGKTAETVAKELSEEMKTNEQTLLSSVQEIEEHLKDNAPLPTESRILIESFDRYLVVHTCFGELVNRTLAGVFDSILSEHEVITGWWTDGYRILIEAPRKFSQHEIAQMPTTLFGLSDQQIDDAFARYVKAKYPFAPKLKAVAERFGVLPRGKTMSYKRQADLQGSFEDTPIYEETLREAMLEKADLAKVKQIMQQVKEGKVVVSTLIRAEKPTPLAYHILEQYADISELMAPERIILSNIEKMKKAIDARLVTLLCMNCNQWVSQVHVKDLPNEPHCENCGSQRLTLLYPSQDPSKLKGDLQKRRENKPLSPEELKELTAARRKADLVLSYGKQAIRALQVKGIGAETASRILGKMHPNEDEFYMDLLKAKIQYLRTREFWDGKEKRL